jgi:hypothetical protein
MAKKKSRSLNIPASAPKTRVKTKSGGQAARAQTEGGSQKKAIATTTKTVMKRQKKKPSRVRNYE